MFDQEVQMLAYVSKDKPPPISEISCAFHSAGEDDGSSAFMQVPARGMGVDARELDTGTRSAMESYKKGGSARARNGN
jgi:hypothetical protein